MPKVAIRALEYAALLVALALTVATSPNDYFWGQVADIPEFSLSDDEPAMELAAVVTMDEGTEFTPPCQAVYSIEANNHGGNTAILQLWALPEAWDGNLPPGDVDNADDDDSADDDDDSADDDDDSADDDDDDSADDDDDSADDDDDSADDDDDDSADDDDDDSADDDDDDSADDDDDDSAPDLPVPERINEMTIPAGESSSLGIMLMVSCEGAPFRILAIGETEGDLDLTVGGTLEVTTQDWASSSSGLSCSPPEGNILEGMSIDFL
jgi:hypothetical protein